MTPHNEAKKDEIAKTVLMPGDPLRAKYIAENYLEDYKLVNKIRSMYAYTGKYKGKEITVMGSGMGIPSIGIYAYELYKFYDVESIIRIGSAGSLDKDVGVGDVVLAEKAYNEGYFAKQFNDDEIKIVAASRELNEQILKTAKQKNIDIKYGQIISADVFDPYIENDKFDKNMPVEESIASEMEAYGLFYLASLLNKKATSLLTIVDSKYSNKYISAIDRQNSLDEMIKLALDSIIKID